MEIINQLTRKSTNIGLILLLVSFFIITTDCVRRQRKKDCSQVKDKRHRSICFEHEKLRKLKYPMETLLNTSELIEEQHKDIWPNFHPIDIEPRFILSKQCSSELCICFTKSMKKTDKKCKTEKSILKSYYVRNKENNEFLEITVKEDTSCSCD